MDLDTDVASPAKHKRGRSVEMMDKPGKRVRFLSPGDAMELCDKAPEASEDAIHEW